MEMRKIRRMKNWLHENAKYHADVKGRHTQ